MSAISNYERRHTIHSGDISLHGLLEDCYNDDSTAASSLCSVSESTIGDGEKLSMLRWEIESEDVSELPEIYPRLSSPLIVRDCEVSEIGERLWTYFNFHDIRSTYDRKRGRILCGTQRVGFIVQFWRRKIQSENATTDPTFSSSSSSNNNCEEEIILEINRRKGCSWAMHKIRRGMKQFILRELSQHQHNQHQHNQHQRRHSSSSLLHPPPQRNSHGLQSIGLISFESILLPSAFQPIINGGESEPTTPTGIQKPNIRSIHAVRDPFSYSLSIFRPTNF